MVHCYKVKGDKVAIIVDDAVNSDNHFIFAEVLRLPDSFGVVALDVNELGVPEVSDPECVHPALFGDQELKSSALVFWHFFEAVGAYWLLVVAENWTLSARVVTEKLDRPQSSFRVRTDGFNLVLVIQLPLEVELNQGVVTRPLELLITR